MRPKPEIPILTMMKEVNCVQQKANRVMHAAAAQSARGVAVGMTHLGDAAKENEDVWSSEKCI